ncbi:uncharacterized protein LOC109723579 isoform X2 [Ananas comosus]|uniref:Uncharacterized protein LOC109723579 isoform X2 n=1 Tax=Ananas comosus TaxID=4615 RepID=A0A6P5GQ83_ANACO|nr:uncharacterized protein LOC109723579 isoform X2 [Ananas comosus]
MDSSGGVESPETGRPAAVVLDFPAGEPSSPAKVPRRIRRRLMEAKSSSPTSVEEIEAKLREADLRRQQFYDWLSSKARPKPRSPSWSSQEEDLGQRLEAKLIAAEQKRLSLLAKAQKRLAKLDELRQAAKTGAEMRLEKEREALGTRVESRVQQAKANRMRLLNAYMQRRAAAHERTARSLVQRIIQENKYKECVQLAIYQKRTAAEKKRMGLLEAERKRAQARVMQARRVAKTVCSQRESERRKMKEQLENRLQRAKRQRAEYLRQRGSPRSYAHISSIKDGEFLSKKLARCWRRFVKSRRTSFALAKAYEVLGINEDSVKSMPFEQLALKIESPTTLQTTKALLGRLESRFLLSQSLNSSGPENIDHLLKHLASPNRKMPSGKSSRTKGTTKKGARAAESNNKLSRYSVRVVLCAYMILSHPNAVFSGQGDKEIRLMESAINFVREFELLVKIILGPNNTMEIHLDSSAGTTCQKFSEQLVAFDAAWRSYLYRFVVWKVKDARALEDDLVTAACKLELSMMQTCKLTPEGRSCDLSHDMRAIQKQVTEDQKLLREKVQYLSGIAGIERMECALSDTRSKFFEAKESGSPLATPIAHISSTSVSNSADQSSASLSKEHYSANNEKPKSVVRSLFGSSSSPPKNNTKLKLDDPYTIGNQEPKENEVLVNEILHGNHGAFANSLDVGGAEENIMAKVKETMEKAFWDGVIDSMKGDEPDYSRILGLVKEVRDELCDLAPQRWRQEILDSIDPDILSQVLESGYQDLEYLGKILEYSLSILRRLAAPASEDDMRKAHEKLLSELSGISQYQDDKRSSAFIIAIVKGLQFVLEEIQKLKKEVSKARIQMLEPIIKGTVGLEYLQKAFADRYGPPSNALDSLPLTKQWISSLRDSSEEEWNEHGDSLSVLSTSHNQPLVTTLRTGGGIPQGTKQALSHPDASGNGEQPECNGERIDLLVRLGLLRLASGIEGVTVQSVPETLQLNALRLRSVQSQLQQIIVISTSMLVLRQIIVSENSTRPPSDLESSISEFAKNLTALLESNADVGIEEIVETMANSSISSSETKLQGRKEIMARMLTKSLQNGDAVFTKVSRSIYLAARAILLGGSGSKGRRLAEGVLRRVGAVMLLDRVVTASEVLIRMATISGFVHGPWYKCLL